jgi:hypothetical protein
MHYCISTVTVVTRTHCHNVMLYINCLSCEFESRWQVYMYVSLCLQHPAMSVLRKTIAQCLAANTSVVVTKFTLGSGN